MLFNSFPFAVLVIITFIVYYLLRRRVLQVLTLVMASIVFYGYAHPQLLILLILSIFINTACSRMAALSLSLNQAKSWATIGVIGNLVILACFKYSSLFASTIFGGLARDNSIGHFLIMIPLPVGISFYTFQGMSLVVDAFKSRTLDEYRGLIVHNVADHWLHTAFFVSFFPQLVAGPIVKAHDFMPQISQKLIGDIDWESCFKLVVLGFFLKIGVADNLNEWTMNWLRADVPFHSLVMIAELFAYSIQIFADFAGYSLIAIGVAKLFGYHLPQNFNFPYISQSFSEFWRRWHISLSSWLREYLYIPLGGNRKGSPRTYVNLFLVMFLGGLWHGAAWKYALWGSFHGLALAIEKLCAGRIHFPDNLCFKIVRIAFVFMFVSFAWLFFKLDNVHDVWLFTKSMFLRWDRKIQMKEFAILYYVFVYSFPVIVFYALHLLKPKCGKYIVKCEPAIFGLMLFLTVFNRGSQAAFVYFQF
jgi:alginate O-acetyltransferase complex protein AlgI